jgi:hypothetical protein
MKMDENANVDVADVTEPQQTDVGASVEALAELREKRTVDYLQKALEMGDPLSANIGAVNADLMLFAGHMRRIIAPALERLPSEPRALANLVPAVESHSRVARQIERLAALMNRLDRQTAAAKKTAAGIVATTGDAPL